MLTTHLLDLFLSSTKYYVHIFANRYSNFSNAINRRHILSLKGEKLLEEACRTFQNSHFGIAVDQKKQWGLDEVVNVSGVGVALSGTCGACGTVSAFSLRRN